MSLHQGHCERQLRPVEVRYYEWCLSDVALHEEKPEWMAAACDGKNGQLGAAFHVQSNSRRAPVLGSAPSARSCIVQELARERGHMDEVADLGERQPLAAQVLTDCF